MLYLLTASTVSCVISHCIDDRVLIPVSDVAGASKDRACSPSFEEADIRVELAQEPPVHFVHASSPVRGRTRRASRGRGKFDGTESSKTRFSVKGGEAYSWSRQKDKTRKKCKHDKLREKKSYRKSASLDFQVSGLKMSPHTAIPRKGRPLRMKKFVVVANGFHPSENRARTDTRERRGQRDRVESERRLRRCVIRRAECCDAKVKPPLLRNRRTQEAKAGRRSRKRSRR